MNENEDMTEALTLARIKMLAANTKAKVIRVKAEQGKAGLFYATSPDLKGLLVAEDTLDGLWEAIPVAIEEMFEAIDIKMIVSQADHPDCKAWVAFPADLAQKRLAAAS